MAPLKGLGKWGIFSPLRGAGEVDDGRAPADVQHRTPYRRTRGIQPCHRQTSL